MMRKGRLTRNISTILYDRQITGKKFKTVKKSFQEVAESFSNQSLHLLNCDWEQSAKIILMSRVNEHISNDLVQRAATHRNPPEIEHGLRRKRLGNAQYRLP